METNFELLDRIMDTLNDKNSDEYRYLRDFKFFLQETERNVYLRKMTQASYTLRMCWDLSKQFTYYLIKNSDTQILIKWNKNIKNRLKIIESAYKAKGKHYNPTIPGFGFLYEEYPSHVDQTIENVGTTYQVVELFKNMNTWMHYNYDTNYKMENNADNKNDKSTLYLHRNKIRYNKPSMEQVIEYLSAIWYVTIDVIYKSELISIKEKPEFDISIYDNPKYVIKKLITSSYVNKFIKGNAKCPICKEGTFSEPNYEELKDKSVKFPHGAYLSCKQSNCWAKLDDSLKVKSELKYDEFADATCPSCRSLESLQRRVNLQEGNGTYVYKACKKCDWNDKNTNYEEADEFVKNEIERMEFFNWDED